MFRIALIQRAVSDRPEANVRGTLEQIEAAARDGAQLVCLQELFATRYFCQEQSPTHFDWAEPADGTVVTQVSQLAARLGVSVLVPFFEKRAPGLHNNSAVLVGPNGETLAHYRKAHIPDDPQFHEKYYFAPGDTGFVRADVPAKEGNVPVAPLICWDQWFPEAARACSLQGASVLVYPTAIGWLPEEKAADGEAQLSAWMTVQRAHAISNGVFVVAVNRVGFEPKPRATDGSGIEFWGHSFVVNPFGEVLAKAGTGEETLLVDLDLSQVEQARRTWPFLRDRRVDLYGVLGRQFNGVQRRNDQ